MLHISRKTLSQIAGLLLVVAGTATLSSAQSIQNATAQPGDIICLAPVQVPVFNYLHVVGNAVDQNNPSHPPVVVKWVAFDNDTNIRLFKVVNSQVDQSPFGNGDHYYACINNNSAVAVTFSLSQTII